MLNYSEKILKSISSRCLCCRTRGIADCHASGVATGKNVRFSTPVAHRIQGHRLDMSNGEAISPLNQVGSSRKRNASNEDSASASKKSFSESSIVINFFKDTVRKVAQMYADLLANTTVTVFGQTQGKLPKRKYIFQHGFATNPWERGVLPLPPHAGTTDMIVEYFSNLPESDLQRHYVIHHSPRLVRITGLSLCHRLIGSRSLDHELVSIMCRRYTQSDMEANRECPYLNWRHNMEPEFATIVLSDHDYVNNISIQKQLVGKDIPYDITSSQMFFLPVPLEAGWVILMWDMMSRKTHFWTRISKGMALMNSRRISMNLLHGSFTMRYSIA
ncbi:uncharacterized protein [Triticum aestivum]|uniref:uncharacterized protein n=1 Tax=Triticum aestivum TaxID=4565 RepID=UPI001D00CFFC|nr:uncharacterized protein LOC123102246 [Triticum aestivum]XP_044379476.1 uncharacterized protein LOC123102246 [Triticum aestivum]XP_044379477.1 uncharacterized protein LOC123102246 [Triticum aestivum]XP_044379478.1 uncharacterized protein LOC123102246 [Triticum aestivum]XP_044379479.1 uncharacterized protein LOC123102246 [Triticum aestivum]XP_044379480.1 uncharacterized protein LOC123102246 [Triticum aestivum]XP_044379481.1 uncharacterized protein LOC123102246 [Triticum aestivum]XP_04437948